MEHLEIKIIIILILIVIILSIIDSILEKLRKKSENKNNNSKDKKINELKYKHKVYSDAQKGPTRLYISKDETIEVNDEKKEIFNLMENSNDNFFITGKAGTGKSQLLKYFFKNTGKKAMLTAPTGISALNISGVTLHSTFGFYNLSEATDIKLSINKRELLKSIDTLIIDEISMVRVDVFNQINKILKIANKNDEPFGGKQVILFGDLFQLPPVAKKEEIQFFTDKYGGIFFFNSPAYKNSKFIFKELNEVFRQDDLEFIKVLDKIRISSFNQKDIDFLNRRYIDELPNNILKVVAKKDEANQINQQSLAKINSQEFIYKAEIKTGENKIKETDFPCDFTLKLKVGALVMMIANDKESKRWVNGTIGIISALSDTHVVVSIDSTDYQISKVPFEKLKCEYNKEIGELEYTVEASVLQYPLVLAYAITIHKSQGLTYEQVACDLKSCFAPGQAYVALSRCKNLNGLYLTEKITPNLIYTNSIVNNFYNNLKKQD